MQSYSKICSQENYARATRAQSTSAELDLRGEANAEAEQDPADDEHGNIDGPGVDDGPGEEHGAAHEHDGSAAHPPGHAAGRQRGQHAGDVHRRRECGEQLVVVLAVGVALGAPHPAEHLREEPLEERLHLRHAA